MTTDTEMNDQNVQITGGWAKLISGEVRPSATFPLGDLRLSAGVDDASRWPTFTDWLVPTLKEFGARNWGDCSAESAAQHDESVAHGAGPIYGWYDVPGAIVDQLHLPGRRVMVSTVIGPHIIDPFTSVLFTSEY